MNKENIPAKTPEDVLDIPHIERRFAITFISIFVAILVLPTLVWGIVNIAGAFNPKIMETIDFDTGENRTLAKFPDSFDPQKFTSEVESWYNDHLPFRSVLYKSQQNLKNAFESPYDKVIRPALLEFFHPSKPGGDTPPDGGGDILDNPYDDPTEPPDNPDNPPPDLDPDDPPPDYIPDEPDTPDISGCVHVLDTEYTVVQEPTCSEFGIIEYACKNCTYTKREYTKKSAHDYVSNMITPMCGTDYTKIYTCSSCETQKTTTGFKKHTPGRNLGTVAPTYLEYGYTLIECADCKHNYKINLRNKLFDTSFFPPIYRSSSALEGRYNWLFYRGNNSEAYYQGTNLLNATQLNEYATVLQQLNDICKQKGITLHIDIYPNKEQVYSEYMPTLTIQDEYKRAERLVDYIKENTDVKIVYPLEELIAAKPYWKLYWEYDTHWTNAGGYIGFQAMMKDLGFEVPNLIDLPVRYLTTADPDYKQFVYDTETSILYGHTNDLISLAGVPDIYPEKYNYVIKYKPEISVLSKVGSNNIRVSRLTTSNGPHDLNFVMLGDSYRRTMYPFLEKEFTSCFMTHRDRIVDKDVKAAIKNADILVISAVERNEPDILKKAKDIIKILQEN